MNSELLLKYNVLNEIKKSISSISNSEELETLIKSLTKLFDSNAINSYPYINDLFYYILFSKLSVLYSNKYLHEYEVDFIKKAINYEKIPDTLLPYFEKILENNSINRLTNQSKDDLSLEAKQPQKVKDILAKLNYLNINKVNYKRSYKLGLSILDHEGNFIWMDELSCKYFELKYKNNDEIINLFDLMIPQSVLSIYDKFESEQIFFDKFNKLNNPITFSYVIFSEAKMHNYIKKKKESYNENGDIKNIYKKNYSENDVIYFKYLNSLSSRATLEQFLFKKEDIEELKNIKDNSCYINYQLLSKYGNSSGFIGIKLETRLCPNMIKFDYRHLKNNPKILGFDRRVNTAIDKFKRKKTCN